MSITLNHSDFQCLQDQLLELKTKNYELAEKQRRGQADFEAAKAKICSLQLKLEEQERDFQVTSTTLRREIELAYNSNNNNTTEPQSSNSKATDGVDSQPAADEDQKAKYKKLLHKAKELQQRYEKSVEVVQQMNGQIKTLTSRVSQFEEENAKLKQELEEKTNLLIEESAHGKLRGADGNSEETSEEPDSQLETIKCERDSLKSELERLTSQVQNLEAQIEERRMHDRKGSQIVKELRRQLALEKNRSETLQKRLESILSESTIGPAATVALNSDLDSRSRLSTSSSTTGNGSSSNGNGSRANNQDANSVSSWSLVQGGKVETSSQALCETLSICSINSEDRETVQQQCDTKSDSSLQPISSSQSTSRQDLSAASISLNSPSRTKMVSTPQQAPSSSDEGPYVAQGKTMFRNDTNNGMLIEEQAALMERVTRLQHDKWTLEEKVSYMEQANAALAEDLANKSDIIKHYFMEQAMKSPAVHHHQDVMGAGAMHNNSNYGNNHRKSSFTVNQLLLDKPSLKKVVDFLKERSQVSSGESENISREATKKMQVMLEETLIKCLKLQENLDFVTSELNKLRT